MADSLQKYIADLKDATAKEERIAGELNAATQIQADMLPRTFPAFPNRKEFDLFASMNPAKEVGGDFYDFFMIDDDHLALVMANVSGKRRAVHSDCQDFDQKPRAGGWSGCQSGKDSG